VGRSPPGQVGGAVTSAQPGETLYANSPIRPPTNGLNTGAMCCPGANSLTTSQPQSHGQRIHSPASMSARGVHASATGVRVNVPPSDDKISVYAPLSPIRHSPGWLVGT